MNYWLYFPQFAGLAGGCWVIAATLQLIGKNTFKASIILTLAGCLVLAAFAAMLWIGLERPPLRTLGETRLWYALFTPLVGAVTFAKKRYKWLLYYGIGMGLLFLLINIMKPETYNKALAPALQSVWFVPHVLVYIFAYALLAVSSYTAVLGLYSSYRGKSALPYLNIANNLTSTGLGFLTLGLLFGALWAKEAWGHYWTWDPKETWALLTWLGYLIYIHLHYRHPQRYKAALLVLALAFVLLLICWFGLNYMPVSVQSVHTYTR